VEEWQASGTEGLVVLRCTVMDPFLGDDGAPRHIEGFIETVRREAQRVLEEG